MAGIPSYSLLTLTSAPKSKRYYRGRSKISKNFLLGLNTGEIHVRQNLEYEWGFLLAWNENKKNRIIFDISLVPCPLG